MAGWGWVCVLGGDGDRDEHAIEMLHACAGPVIIEKGHPAFLGATKLSNNTGELSAAAELLLGLRLMNPSAPPPDSRGVIRPDSELVMGVMTGRVAVKENVMLAKRVRELWLSVRARYGGRLTHRWIKGHSSHVWNDRADALAELGRLGDINTVRDEWQEAKDAHEHVPLVSLVGRFAFSVASTLTAFFLSTKSFRGPESRQCALWGVGIVSLQSNSATRNTVKLFPRGESKRFFYRRRSLCTTRPQWYHTDGTRVERFICSPWE
jgi:ribonuclease HI